MGFTPEMEELCRSIEARTSTGQKAVVAFDDIADASRAPSAPEGYDKVTTDAAEALAAATGSRVIINSSEARCTFYPTQQRRRRSGGLFGAK